MMKKIVKYKLIEDTLIYEQGASIFIGFETQLNQFAQTLDGEITDIKFSSVSRDEGIFHSVLVSYIES